MMMPRKADPPLYKNPIVIAALIGAAVPLLIWWWSIRKPVLETIYYRVTVTETGALAKPIAAARVKLTLTRVGTVPFIKPTDTEGNAVFTLPREAINTLGTVDVGAQNYHAQTQTVNILSADASLAILLTPLEAANPPPPPPHLEPYSSTKTLGPVPSGSGSGKIEYAMESDPPRDGYKITSASYSLSGDRAPCGNFSWCWWKQKDETRAIFAFQLQGHNEWPSPGVSLTAGTLTVTYGPR
jgi:hypothetical protein